MLDDLWSGVDNVRQHDGKQPRAGSLYGAEFIDKPDEIVWADSVRGVRALREAGFPQSVALIPAGGADLFVPLADHGDLLRDLKRVTLACEDKRLAEELARRLGRHRISCVTWPQDRRSVSDVLQQDGATTLHALIVGAEPYPRDGIQHVSPTVMLELRHAPPPPVLSTGITSLDDILALPGEGRLIVVTGIPNHGKSTFVTHLMAHTATECSRRWAVFSPEMSPWTHLASKLLQWRAGKSFIARTGFDGMSDAEISAHATWCAQRFAFLTCDATDAAPTLDWLMERWMTCILRQGITDVLVDPWNEIEHQHGDLSETDYTGRALQRLRSFSNRHGVNVWIVAHPTKIKPVRPGDPVPVPTYYDINGSSNWANKSDVILVVHTPDLTVTQVHVAKACFARYGRRGTVAEIELDPLTGRYRSASLQPTYEGKQ